MLPVLTYSLSVCLSARAPISFAFFWWLTGADGCSSLSALSFTTRDLHDGILVHADICDNVEVNPLLVQGVKQGVYSGKRATRNRDIEKYGPDFL